MVSLRFNVLGWPLFSDTLVRSECLYNVLNLQNEGWGGGGGKLFHGGSPWTGSMKGSMDRVHRGGPWT